ncbi:MAG: hypothetical protein QOH10_2867 [Actinomycetota bacterium]|nr:hypothetical protein [Actinomycetota bacterium]
MSDGNASEPVFVVGAMRSGTTLLRLMLNEHSELAIPAESHFLLALFRDFGPERVLSGDEIVRALALVTDTQEWQRDYGHTDAELRVAVGDGPLSMAEFIDRVFRLEISDTGKPRWGDKTPQNLFRVPDLLATFPSAKVVAIVRDPRDVYLSLRNRDWVGDSCWEIGRYTARCGSLVSRWRTRFPPERFTCVRYEDLVLDPEATLRSVCCFADLDFEPAMLAFYEHADRNIQNWEFEIGAHTKLRRPVQAADVGRWREARSPLARLQVAQIEALTSDVMTDFGYDSHLPPTLRAPARSSAHLSYRLAKLLRDPAVVMRAVKRSRRETTSTPRPSAPVATVAQSEARNFEAQLSDHTRGFVVDVVDPHAPTVVAFGGIGGGVGIPHYEFFRVLDGLQVNRVFVRDVDQRLYHKGVRGLGVSFAEVGRNLGGLLPPQSDNVVFVGSSAGGFAAIAFGSLIGVDRVVVVAPLTFIDRRHRLVFFDRRWPRSINPVNRGANVQRGYLDLRTVIRDRTGAPLVDVYFPRRHRLAALHARRLEGLPDVHLHPIDSLSYDIVREMYESGALRDILVDSIRPGEHQSPDR